MSETMSLRPGISGPHLDAIAASAYCATVGTTLAWSRWRMEDGAMFRARVMLEAAGAGAGRVAFVGQNGRGLHQP